ncbi:fructosamine kinase family protein [Sphingosinicella terrae]|uniref:fructosamine kinase family protein n=1 Tax=Sphingosinicella terrae TaxID=2172047 RepID=UPI000E0D87BC|nr:fructosamine kinase family protein [Sphingosinicella terrae]
MTAFAGRVADLLGLSEEAGLERLAGGDLSEVLLIRRPDGHLSVAKGGPAVGTEASMLRALRDAGARVPTVEGEHSGVLLLEHVAGDGLFTPRAWADMGEQLARLHAVRGDDYGWPVNYALGTVQLDNRPRSDWPGFWGEQRLAAVAAMLDRPWRERVGRVVSGLDRSLPQRPPPSLLHGDLWSGNIIVREGTLAAFLDPACYHGDAEVDLAMLTLFDAPPDSFWEAYGPLEPDWPARRPVYQLFPALVHLRLFGDGYAKLTDRLLGALDA